MRHLSLMISAALCGVSFNAQSDLFFSEYIEGSSFNKVLEIYNLTGADVDLSNYTINLFSNGNAAANASYTLSGTLAADCHYVISHASADAAVLAIADDTNSSVINFNGDDAVTLENAGVVVDAIGQVGFDPGSEWGSGDVTTKDHTLQRMAAIMTGDTDSGDAFDPAAEWDGLPQNTFSGLESCGSVVEPPEFHTIAEIQGAGHSSPYDGIAVTTSGIVTAVSSIGYYLQDPVGDSDDATSEGVFVYLGSAPSVAVGDSVEVEAYVDEYTPGGSSTDNLSITELTGPVTTVVSSGNAVPAAVVIGQAGRMPPTEIIDDDNFAVFDPDMDGIDFYESMEGMRVTVADAVAVAPTNQYGETFVIADQGAAATGLNSRSGISISPADFNPERMQLQIEGDFTGDFELASNAGEVIGDATGVVSFNYGNFEILLTEEPVGIVPSTLTAETTAIVSSGALLTVASYNVENLDPVVEDISLVTDSDDIDDDVGDGKFAAIAGHIVAHLNAPDIVALQEMQDSDGAQNTGTVDSDVTAQTLIDAIVAASGPVYEYVDLAPTDGMDGGQPGGNIRVGFLYNPARVTLDESSVQKVLDTDLSDGDAFDATRKSLYAAFEFNGETVHLINNHFSSKGGSSPLFGSVQPPVNGRIENREAQAAVINDFVDGLLLSDAAAKVIVLGDLNEFFFESPLTVLKGEEPVLTNLNETLPVEEAWSYIYEGNSQALDHTLISAALSDKVSGYDLVHVNAEFVDQASDHDPMVLAVDFAPHPGLLNFRRIARFYTENVENGKIMGLGDTEMHAKINLMKFSRLFYGVRISIAEGETTAVCDNLVTLIDRSDRVADSWITGGPAVTRLNKLLTVYADQQACE